ncbi:NUDIX domain-containing protein [Candidatus Woesearchaeota archaeon]|jgi:8-oxo-dGTP pyrophosphatase MutT (NUDIX family)|nr:NUDIX domain-containing protein [Candidatus Woesearchaeota archaeon]
MNEQQKNGVSLDGESVGIESGYILAAQVILYRRVLPSHLQSSKYYSPILALNSDVDIERDANLEVLLTKRPDNFRHYPGEYVFPGGKQDFEEIKYWDLKRTGVREVEEEIGVSIDQSQLTYLFTSITTLGERECRVDMYAAPMPYSQTPQLSSEVDNLVWGEVNSLIGDHDSSKIKISRISLEALLSLSKNKGLLKRTGGD